MFYKPHSIAYKGELMVTMERHTDYFIPELGVSDYSRCTDEDNGYCTDLTESQISEMLAHFGITSDLQELN